MNKARSFFFVCAGLLCLALAYHVGARSATAQVTGTLVAGSFDPDTDALGIDAGGMMWLLSHNGAHMGPIALPKAGTVIEATGANVGGTTFQADVLYADGDAYHFDRTSWAYVGNVFSGSTPTHGASWGSLKVRYRGERGAAQPMPEGR